MASIWNFTVLGMSALLITAYAINDDRLPWNAKTTDLAESSISDIEDVEVSEIDDCPENLSSIPDEFRTHTTIRNGNLIVIFKRPYKIGLYKDGTLVSEDGTRGCFPISMGASPHNPKVEYDNASTPEDWYHLAEKRTADPDDDYPSTVFDKALLVSYPNLQDVHRAEHEGIIDNTTAKAMLADIEAGKLPRQDSGMGGWIMIHKWVTSNIGSTAGCIGADDENMEWLFSHVENDMPILILPWRLVMFEDGTFSRDEATYERLDAEAMRELAEFMNSIEPDENGRIVMPAVVITGD